MNALLGTAALAGGAATMALLFRELWFAALWAHFLAGAAGYALARRIRSECEARLCFDAAVAFLLPAVGGAAAWLLAAGPRRESGEDMIGNSSDASAVFDALTHVFLRATRRIFHPDPAYLVPMVDVIDSSADVEDKRNAIETLLHLETPTAVDALRRALGKESVEVRFFAASALAKLEERLARRVAMLEEDLATGRGDERRVRLDLAQASLDYSYYHIVQDTRREFYLGIAWGHARSVAMRDDWAEAWLLTGRALLALKRYDEAREAFDRYLAKKPEDARGYLWRAEIHFHLRDFESVRADCAEARRHGDVPGRMQPILAMWLDDGRNGAEEAADAEEYVA